MARSDKADIKGFFDIPWKSGKSPQVSKSSAIIRGSIYKSHYYYEYFPNGISTGQVFKTCTLWYMTQGYSQATSSVRGQPKRPLISNPFSTVLTRWQGNGGKVRRYLNLVTYQEYSGEAAAQIFYDGVLPPVSHDALQADLMASATQRAFAKATQPYVPALHWMGEMRETIQALRSPLSGIRTLGRKIIPRASKIAGKILKGGGRVSWRKAIATAYLEVQFGLLPLVEMADMSAKKLAYLSNAQFEKVQRHTGHAASTVVTSEIVLRGASEQYGCYFRVETTTTIDVHARMKVRPVSPTGLMPNFTFGNVAAQGWELLPLSFVANWALNMSQLLKASRPIPGSVLDSYCTVLVQTMVKATMISGKYANIPMVISGDVSFERTKTSITRHTPISRPGKLFLGSGIGGIGKKLSLLALLPSILKK